jgi:beta-N-acetylhexosaminidase
MWGFMVRSSVIALCIILLPNATFGIPKPGEKLSVFSDVIRVEGMEGFRPWESPRTLPPDPPKLSQADCRRYGAQNGHPECAPYRSKVNSGDAEKQNPAGVKPHVDPGTATNTNSPAKKLEIRAVSERERKPTAIKPPPAISSIATLSPKGNAGAPPQGDLATMAGQLLLVAFKGKQPTDPDVVRIADALRDGKISGVIVNDSNVVSFPQLRQLLVAITRNSGRNIPLISLDQPGGPDSSLPEDKGFTFYASANFVSNDQTPYGAQLFYRDMAAELAGLGITLNIGPSADACRDEGVNLSASCFGTAPSRIASFATAFSAGHHDRGVLTALRHVPFYKGLQTSWISERANTAILHEVMKREPSDALVVRRKATEPSPLPASLFTLLPRKTQSELYRGSGFAGALICELDMQTGGAPIRYGEAIIRAFEAGADMLLLRDPSLIPSDISAITLDAIQAGLKSGRLQRTRIEDAYVHVTHLKERLRGFHPKMQIARVDR